MDAETGIPPPFFPIVMALDWSSTVNGMLGEETYFEFTQGETVLFRTVNAGVEPDARLYFNESSAPDFLVVAEDGFPVPELVSSSGVNIGAGSRREFMIKFDVPGIYTLRREAWTAGGIHGVEACNATFGIPLPSCISYDVDQPIAIITVLEADTPIEARLPTELPEYHQHFKDLEAMPVVNNRTITLQVTQGFPIFQIPYDGPFVPPGTAFGINNLLLTPHHSHGELMDGTCEEWTVISDPPGMEHDFHIHTNPFLVTHVDGIPLDEPVWRDTYRLYGFNITIKTCFNRLEPGDYVLVHCHQITHLDIGVRSWVRLCWSFFWFRFSPCLLSFQMGAYFTVVSGNETDMDDMVLDDGLDEPAPADDGDQEVAVDRSGSGTESKNSDLPSSALGRLHGGLSVVVAMVSMFVSAF